MPFDFSRTPIDGLLIVTPRTFLDERGYFLETYKQSEFAAAGITDPFVQDNHSYSTRGVVRGIHFQSPPYAQGKLVRVVTGSVWDVAVDLRRESPTFGQWYALELNDHDRTMLYIPPGFGHAFVVLSPDAHFHYKCTREYSGQSEAGVRYSDPDLSIQWPVDDVRVSPKDAALPLLADADIPERSAR